MGGQPLPTRIALLANAVLEGIAAVLAVFVPHPDFQFIGDEVARHIWACAAFALAVGCVAALAAHYTGHVTPASGAPPLVAMLLYHLTLIAVFFRFSHVERLHGQSTKVFAIHGFMAVLTLYGVLCAHFARFPPKKKSS
eukprot:TRINITY_DN26890_c0_g1_i1.p1 TRINITY_DN26890_c0_g1~~TRINITY_DN26890_c0_g1_i1.p1  ORF type:complete len:159 (-),score=39.90 TRINITY_DN26890_c0_g1_i1:84-500(-)